MGLQVYGLVEAAGTSFSGCREFVEARSEQRGLAGPEESAM